MGAYVCFCFAGFFRGEGLHYSLALLFFLKYIQTFSKKKYLILKTPQFGLNKRRGECSVVFMGNSRKKAMQTVHFCLGTRVRMMW